MGRKSTAKQANASSSASGTPPSEPRRSSTPLLAAGIVLVLAIVGLIAYTRSSQPAPAAEVAQAAAPIPDVPATAKLGPHPQENLPPLPFQAYAPPRPMETVKAVYRFAAEHPEVLSYVPCFCGCERGGHKGNDDCFVKARNAQGDVTEWEPHGLDCTVCIDVANEAMQMTRSGASVTAIRNAIEAKWNRPGSGHTPTPIPHAAH
ncbi:MAG: hypothetical protein JWL71_4695 [Acidobacteria bacterium]|nr:hypothetical protein [Acidobacteriota bacterium]